MKNERGIALVISLFLMAALSALAVSLVFLSETETSASRNYKTMSQARYAAEAGVHRAVNYLLLDTFKTSMTSNLASFDLTQSPVKYNGSDVVISASSGVSSNYPDASVTTAFGNSVKGTLPVGTGYSAFSASAKLLSMRTVDVYGSQPDIIMTWRITGTGTVCKGTGTCNTSDPSTSTLGTLDVTATLERDLNHAESYAVFATYQGCSALTLNGNVNTNSYDSQTMATTPPPTPGTSGGVGTNGNLNVGGTVAINGTLSTPRTGAGACSASNPDAITGSGSWSYQGTVPLPQAIAFPTPTAPTGVPTTNVTLSSGMTGIACTAAVTASGWSCAVNSAAKTVTLTPVTSNTLTLGNVTVGSNTTLVIAGGSSEIVNVNSFLLGSNAAMSMTSSPAKTTVTMNIAGQSLSVGTLPLDLSGGGTVNDTYDPTRLQILYAGTDQLKLVGNNTLAATIYAPNAAAKTTGHGNLYGSVLSSTFTDTGGAQLHYDTSLQKRYQTLGNYVMSSFSWRKY
jgi:hypothetical protein